MFRSTIARRCSWVLGVPLFAVGAAHGQLADGNLDGVPIGTAPDCATPAGAWQFPANYSTLAACETDPTQYTVVDTTTFDPTHPGNSLALNINDAVDNIHMCNLLTGGVITPAAGQIVRVEYDLWVNSTGDGGSLYVGYDAGGGGLSNATDRGPQVSWVGDGTIAYNVGGVLNTVVTGYPRGQWQHVRLDIRFDVHNYDFYWAPLSGGSLQQLGSHLAFRAATPPSSVDRISIAHFGATANLNVSSCYYDNFTFAIITPSTCYANCDGSTAVPFLNITDFTCFQSAFAAGSSYANCDNSTTPPVLNVNDFICFQGLFAAGCSAP
jgi:hypothetical protein